MAFVEYRPGNAFPGTVGRTVEESSPAWPTLEQAGVAAPNVMFIVLDDTGFAQLGCYGSPIRTPCLDALAADGLRYRNMHTTAMCSPTRACILTGRNAHSNGMGTVLDFATGYPGYNGRLPPENGLLSEILVRHGYSTYAVGKWHLVPGEEQSAAGPYDNWPLGRGFERYYGFLVADTNQYYPELVYDNHQVAPPRTPEQGYHLTEDLVDRAIEFITDTRQVAPDKPFFLYLCPAATHAPHQVPREWADRYRGAFDDGWDAYRERALERQKELGVIPAEAELPLRDPDVPPWDSLSADEKRLHARMMEVFAGYLEHTDHHIGRLLSRLGDMGELDNTIIMVVSDNGASGDGGPSGVVNGEAYDNNVPGSLELNLAAINDLGGPSLYNIYALGWAWAGNSPFRRWKRETYRGGVSEPFIVHWPAGVRARGEVREQYVHAIDIVPTVLDVLGIKPPPEIKGIWQAPIHGVSFAKTFNDGAAASEHTTQYFEMLAHRSIYHRGWRAVCPWPGPSFAESAPPGTPLSADDLRRIDDTGWELYYVDEDFTERHNVAAEHPEKLREMIALWYAEATKYQVFPLDGRAALRLAEERPHFGADRTHFVYYPGTQRVPDLAAVKVYNRGHTITADVEIPPDGAEGVLMCHIGGYSLFVKDRRLHYVHKYVGAEEFQVASSAELPVGRVSLSYTFEPTGEPDLARGRGTPGLGRLFVDGNLVGEAAIPVTTPILFYGGVEIGHDSRAQVTALYNAPFAFTGTIYTVTVDVYGERPRDVEAEARTLLAKQ